MQAIQVKGTAGVRTQNLLAVRHQCKPQYSVTPGNKTADTKKKRVRKW